MDHCSWKSSWALLYNRSVQVSSVSSAVLTMVAVLKFSRLIKSFLRFLFEGFWVLQDDARCFFRLGSSLGAWMGGWLVRVTFYRLGRICCQLLTKTGVLGAHRNN